MHAEEFDFSEDDSDDDIQEERFSFAEELSETTEPPKLLDDVEVPEPPTPSSDFPSISLVGEGDGVPAPVPAPQESLSHSQAQPQPAGEVHDLGAHDLGAHDLGDHDLGDHDSGTPSGVPMSLQGEDPTLPHTPEPLQDPGVADLFHVEEAQAPELSSEFHGEPHDAGGHIEEDGGGGNRPARGARQISAGEILSGDFHGGINAGDFLGLDTEFTGPPDPLGSVQELVNLQPSYPPSYEDDFDESNSSGYDDPDAPVFGNPSDSSAAGFAPPADPYDSDEEFEGEEELQEIAYEEPRNGPLRLVLVTLFCALLGASGVFYAPKIISGELNVPGFGWVQNFFPANEGVEVASGPSGAVTPPVSDTNSPGATNTTTDSVTLPPVSNADPSNSLDPAGTDPVDPTPTGIVSNTVDPDPLVEPPLVADTTSVTDPTGVNAQDPLGDMTQNPGNTNADSLVDTANTTPVGTNPLTVVVESPSVASGDSAVPPSGGVGNLLENLLGGSEPVGQTGFPDLNAPNISWISDDRLDMIWRGEEIPEGAIDGPVQTLMPHVGSVRVTMHSEQIFEGRLYAAGQRGIWLEFASGRIRLPSEGIDEIERLAEDPNAVHSAETAAANGKRVRVKVPGGLIFGRVQKQHGALVTIKTDNGARVVVESHLVEALGARRAVLIHR